MKYTVALFTILAFAALFAMITPIDIAVAQTSNAMPDGEYKEGEGKSCPSKEKKEASISATLLI